jgi:hypothetical protein
MIRLQFDEVFAQMGKFANFEANINLVYSFHAIIWKPVSESQIFLSSKSEKPHSNYT